MDDVGLQVHDTLSLNSPASPVRHSRFAFLNTNLGVGSGASPLYVRGVTNVFDLEENKCNYLNFHFPSSRLATSCKAGLRIIITTQKLALADTRTLFVYS